jgi:aspartate racemase
MVMKKIGIVGGMGPESTVDYYQGIIDAFKEKGGGFSYPEIIMYSVNLSELLMMMEHKEWTRLTEWLVRKIEALRRAGAEFAAIGANTPHVVFDDVDAEASLPIISIVEATCRSAKDRGVKRPLLLGTKFTMESDFFQKPFRDQGMSIVVPDYEDREYIHLKLMSEIELGIIQDSTRDGLLAIVKKMIEKASIDSVILGCTELPMILTRDEFGIPFLNTTAIHIGSIVDYCLST